MCSAELTAQKDMKVLKHTQRMATKLVEGLKGMSCAGLLRTLVLPSLEEKRLRGNFLLSAASGGGEVEREVLISSPWSPVIR